MATTNPFYLVPLFAVAFFVHSACRRPGPHARSFKLFAAFGVLTIVTRTTLVVFLPTITAGAVAAAGLEGLRLAVMLAIFGAFNSVSDPYGVLKLAPRRWHEPALAAALALSMAPRTIAAVGEVREAQRLRGIDVRRLRSLVALAVPVLANGMEGAVSLAESMDARGHGRGRRSRYRPARWNAISLVLCLSAIVALLTFGVALYSGNGALSMSTFPLVWPDATVWLIAAVTLLAAPALVAPASEVNE